MLLEVGLISRNETEVALKVQALCLGRQRMNRLARGGSSQAQARSLRKAVAKSEPNRLKVRWFGPKRLSALPSVAWGRSRFGADLVVCPPPPYQSGAHPVISRPLAPVRCAPYQWTPLSPLPVGDASPPYQSGASPSQARQQYQAATER